MKNIPTSAKSRRFLRSLKKVLIVNWGTIGSSYAFEVAKKKPLDIYLATTEDHPAWVKNIVPHKKMIFTNPYDSDKLITDVTRFCLKNHINFDSILTFFEMNIIQTADLAHTLGFNFVSPQAARKSSGNKLLMRIACRKNNIPTPNFEVFRSKEEGYSALKKIGVPAVIKPVRSGHSYGTILIENPGKINFFRKFDQAKGQLSSNIDEWMKYYNQYKNDFLIEEYIDGKVISVDGLIQEGKVMICGITEFSMSPPPLFIQEAVTIPGNFNQKTRALCFKHTRRIVKAIGLNNCAFHAEFRLTNKGPVLLEIAARPPGGNMPLAYKNAYGFDIIDMYLDICLGKKVHFSPQKPKFVIIHRSHFINDWGELTKLKGIEKLAKKPYLTIYWSRGKNNMVFPTGGVPASIIYYQIKAKSESEANRFQREVYDTLDYSLSKTPGAVKKYIRLRLGLESP